jgi:hypothetical protein
MEGLFESGSEVIKPICHRQDANRQKIKIIITVIW